MGREQWLENRRRGIGGSDWGDILGLEPYGCPRRAWYDKRGVKPDYPESQTGAMKRGQKLERLVVEEFVEVHRRTVWYPDASIDAARDFFKHSGRAKKIGRRDLPEWWIGTPDAAIMPLPDEKKPTVAEVKTKGPWAYVKIERNGPPEREIAQVQHYLGLTGWAAGTFLYFEPVDWRLLPLPIDRDPKMLATMIDVGNHFWKLVQSGEESSMIDRLDSADQRCRNCPWFPTCQDLLVWDGVAKAEAGDYTECDNPEIDRMVSERVEIMAVRKDAEAMIDEINQALLAAVEGDAKIQATAGKLRVGAGKRTYTDMKLLEAKYPRVARAIYDKFRVTVETARSVTVYPRKEDKDG